jgi:hypothetical protein
MRRFFLVFAAILAAGFLAVSQSDAQVSVTFGVPGPVYYGPGYYPGYFYGPGYYALGPLRLHLLSASLLAPPVLVASPMVLSLRY